MIQLRKQFPEKMCTVYIFGDWCGITKIKTYRWEPYIRLRFNAAERHGRCEIQQRLDAIDILNQHIAGNLTPECEEHIYEEIKSTVASNADWK